MNKLFFTFLLITTFFTYGICSEPKLAQHIDQDESEKHHRDVVGKKLKKPSFLKRNTLKHLTEIAQEPEKRNIISTNNNKLICAE